MSKLMLVLAVGSVGCASGNNVQQAVFYGSLAALASVPALVEARPVAATSVELRCGGSSCLANEECVGWPGPEHCEVSTHPHLQLTAKGKQTPMKW